ncbi:unnamed protein product [Closterium sp. NIES-64]|nr:unnamed protein product [Closterium sp. NIES-64]
MAVCPPVSGPGGSPYCTPLLNSPPHPLLLLHALPSLPLPFLPRCIPSAVRAAVMAGAPAARVQPVTATNVSPPPAPKPPLLLRRRKGGQGTRWGATCVRQKGASHRLHYECAARPPLHGARCSLRMPCVPCASRATAGAPLAGATALAPAPLQCRAVQGASLHLPCRFVGGSLDGAPPSTILPRLAHSCQLSPPFPLPFPPPFWPLLRCSLLSHGSLPPRPYNVNLPTPFPPAILLPIFILVFSPSPHSMRLPLLGAVAPCPCIPCMCAHPAPCPPTPAPSPSCALPLTPALLSALSLPFPPPFLPLFFPRPGPSPLPSPPCAIDSPAHLSSAPHSTWAHVPLGHLLLRTHPALLASLLSPVASAMHHLHPSARTLANAAALHARAPPPQRQLGTAHLRHSSRQVTCAQGSAWERRDGREGGICAGRQAVSVGEGAGARGVACAAPHCPLPPPHPRILPLSTACDGVRVAAVLVGSMDCGVTKGAACTAQ